MKLQTKAHEFGPTVKRIVDAALARLEQYKIAGFLITLRQLFYRLVADGVRENTTKDYRNLGRYMNFAKEAGILDWDAIEDRTRYLRGWRRYSTTTELVEEAAEGWHMDFWAGQPYRPEVWIEKDAQLSIIAPVCDEFDVRYYACADGADRRTSLKLRSVSRNSIRTRISVASFCTWETTTPLVAVRPRI